MSRIPKYRHIEHTADVGLLVNGVNLHELFENAAEGLFDIIADVSRLRPLVEQTVHVESTDREALLVTWLSELNYRFLTEKLLYCRFAIESLSETDLRATVYAEPLDLEKHEIFTEVKAVTYHQLFIKESNDGWQAQIIFDL
jgi:SHS2 domain-containing protein